MSVWRAFPAGFIPFLVATTVAGIYSKLKMQNTSKYETLLTLLLPADPLRLSNLCRPISRIGLPYSESLVDRTLLEVSGTVLAARLALEFGLSCNLAGGTHHAHRDFGSG